MRHPFTKIVVLTFLPPLVATLIILVCGGCAKIPSGGMPDPEEEVIVMCTVTVAVSVFDGAYGLVDDLLVSPGREIIVPAGDSVRIAVDAFGLPNTRIAAVSADGEGLFSSGGGAVANNVAVTLRAVFANTEVLVELARIDDLFPTVEILWPALIDSGKNVERLPQCVTGAIGYRLNKRMASGVIKWRNLADYSDQGTNPLRSVGIPEEIDESYHLVGNLTYASPLEYLEAGLQKFDLTVSPMGEKRVQEDIFSKGSIYLFELRFTDSLGNVSAAVTRKMVSGSEEADSCASARFDWEQLK